MGWIKDRIGEIINPAKQEAIYQRRGREAFRRGEAGLDAEGNPLPSAAERNLQFGPTVEAGQRQAVAEIADEQQRKARAQIEKEKELREKYGTIGYEIDEKTGEKVYLRSFVEGENLEIGRSELTNAQKREAGIAVKAAKKAKAKRKSDLDKALENIEFDDQSFLWDFFENFQNIDFDRLTKSIAKNRLEKGPYEPGNIDDYTKLESKAKYLYKNFLQIQDDEPLVTLNRFLGYGVDSFNEVTNPQLSSIVPYFRLYKVVGDDFRTEFPFNKFTSIKDILESNTGRGTDVGFKSISWEDTSNNPGNTGLQFKGSLKLHFQSFEAIFKERRLGRETITFADLLHKSSALGKNASKNEKSSKQEAAQSSGVNGPAPFEIHAEVGWTFPADESQGENIEFGNKLLYARRVYVLEVLDQQMDFTENGTVDLTVDFCARIEGRAFSQNSDLLAIDESSTPAFSFDPFEEGEGVTISQIKKDYRKGIKEYTDNITKTQENKALSKKQRSNSIKKIQKERDELKKQYGEFKTQTREIRYKRFLDLIRSGTENRMFFYDIDAKTYQWYEKFLKFQVIETDGIKNEQDKELKDTLIEEYRIDRLAKLNEIDDGLDPNQIGFASEDSLTSTVKQIKNKSKQKQDSKIKDGVYRINYIYLGDLIETAMEIIYKNPSINFGKRAKDNPSNNGIKNDIKVCLSSFPYVNPKTGKVISIQMADIPISLNYFNSWWYDNVISKDREAYPLNLFLKDFCSKLLNNVIAPKKYGGTLSKSFSFKIEPIFTKSEHPINQLWNKNPRGKKRRVSKADLFGRRGFPGGSGTTQWLYMYVRGGETENSKLNGDPNEDRERNLPHFYVGADKGIVKNISFSRTKIKGKLESSLQRSKEEGNLNPQLLFADRYDADLTLFGNPTFKPGMLIYVNPRSLGLGIATEDARSYMSELGVGGYYRIYKVSSELSEESFETKLDTKLELSTREIFKNKKRG